MTRFVVGTDGTATSDRLREYLRERVDEGSHVIVVSSLPGGEETDDDDVTAAEAAVDAVIDDLTGGVTVETHVYVRGNDPAEDLLQAAQEFDADELVIGIRRRSPTGKALFGSTAQRLLLNADRPVLGVPL